jgi:hypothetical protein
VWPAKGSGTAEYVAACNKVSPFFARGKNALHITKGDGWSLTASEKRAFLSPSPNVHAVLPSVSTLGEAIGPDLLVRA